MTAASNFTLVYTSVKLYGDSGTFQSGDRACCLTSLWNGGNSFHCFTDPCTAVHYVSPDASQRSGKATLAPEAFHVDLSFVLTNRSRRYICDIFMRYISEGYVCVSMERYTVNSH